MTSRNLEALTESMGRLQGIADALTFDPTGDTMDVTDDTGQLTISLSAGQITGLRLGTQWKSKIPFQSLGDQILILTMKPVFDRLNSAFDSGTPAPAAVQEVPPMRWSFPNDETRDRMANEARDVSHEIDRLTQAGATPEPPARHEFTSRNQLVTATMTQGTLSSLTYDDAVETAALQTIVDSTMEALELAYNAPPPEPEAATTELGVAMERVEALQNEAADYRVR